MALFLSNFVGFFDFLRDKFIFPFYLFLRSEFSLFVQKSYVCLYFFKNLVFYCPLSFEIIYLFSWIIWQSIESVRFSFWGDLFVLSRKFWYLIHLSVKFTTRLTEIHFIAEWKLCWIFFLKKIQSLTKTEQMWEQNIPRCHLDFLPTIKSFFLYLCT